LFDQSIDQGGRGRKGFLDLAILGLANCCVDGYSAIIIARLSLYGESLQGFGTGFELNG